jgi:hypothetical protein
VSPGDQLFFAAHCNSLCHVAAAQKKTFCSLYVTRHEKKIHKFLLRGQTAIEMREKGEILVILSHHHSCNKRGADCRPSKKAPKRRQSINSAR